MTTWFHTVILATGIAATVAVGIASAAAYRDTGYPVARKADRLTTATATASAGLPEITVEQRTDGVSILTRVPATVAD